jgi:hypothetical protein
MLYISILLLLLTIFLINISGINLFVSAQIIQDHNKNESENYIPHIYPTQSGGEQYRFNKSNPNDLIQVNETEDPTVFSKKNSDNSWKVDKGKTRIEIFTKQAGTLSEESLKEKATSWNYEDLSKIGYWLNTKDWKNIEFTLIFKFDYQPSAYNNINHNNENNKNKEHDISIVTRSIFHDAESAYSEDDNNK